MPNGLAFALGAVLLAGLVLLAWAVSAGNELKRLRNQIAQAEGNMDVFLKQRYDLIPQLVAVARGYMAHERDLLERVTRLRSQAVDSPGTTGPAVHAQAGEGVGRIMALLEDYPASRADAHTLRVMREMAEAEDQIAASRSFFNSAVTQYNNAVASFPGSVVAGALGMTPRETYAIRPQERERPAV